MKHLTSLFILLGLLVVPMLNRTAVFRPALAADERSVQDDEDPKKKFRKSRLTYDEAEASADHRNLPLIKGQDKTVDLEFDVAGANGITIGNPGVVATTLVKLGERRQLVFKPLAKGDTTVTLRDSEGTIKVIFHVSVVESPLERLQAELKDLLRDVEGIDIRIVGEKVIVEGEVIVPSDYGRIAVVLGDKIYANSVINLTSLSPLALQILAQKMQDEIQTFAPNVTTRVVNGIIFLQGTVDREDDARRAQRIAYLYIPEQKPSSLLSRDAAGNVQSVPPRRPIENFIVINAPPPKKTDRLVRVTVHFVELSKDYNKVFGFKWQPGFTPGSDTLTIGGTAGSTPSFGATISSLFPKLQSAQAAGYARVLKTGTVVVKSGQPASLSEGAQVPYIIQGAQGATAGTAQAQFSIGVTPTILGQSEDIELTLKLAQTAFIGRAANGQAPQTANHNVDTKLYVKANESAAVAGITSSDVGTDFNKDDPRPGSFTAAGQGSTQTDSLFSLLHSKNYRKKKSQFVVFVTPQIIENASEGTEDLKKNFRVKVK